MVKASTPVVMTEITDPQVLAEFRRQDEAFDRNLEWFEAHALDAYRKHRGKCLCIAGQELFVADTPEQAIAMARAAHPDDPGAFTRIVPKERCPRIYASRGTVACL